VEPVDVVLANLTDVGTVLLAATSGEIAGVVMSDGGTSADTADDVVVEGVTVDAYDAGTSTLAASVTTDSSGAYRFDSLAPGDYDLAFTMAGFADGSLTGRTALASGNDGNDVTLVAWQRTLTGTVADTSATPLSGVSVTAVNAAGVTVGTTTTDGSGLYALVLATGTYQVTFDDGAGTTSTPAVAVEGTDPISDQTLDVTL
jgi:large repetitive protein